MSLKENGVHDTPDYGFGDGLWLAGADNDTHQPKSIEVATPEEIRSLSKEPYNPDHMSRVAEQMSNPRYVRSLGGLGVELAVIGNPDADELKVIMYGWGGNFRNPNAVREAIALTYENPKVAYMFTNMPGTGNSEMLPGSARKKMKKTGSYMPLGEYLGPVVDHVGQDYGNITVNGHSLGGRVAMSTTGHMARRVSEVNLIDPVGSRDMGAFALGHAFILREGKELVRYEKSSLVLSAKELGLSFLSQNNPETIELIAGLSEEYAREFSRPKHGWRQQFLTDTLALSKAGFQVDLMIGAPNVQDKIRIFVPELSHLNKWRDIARIAGMANYAAETLTKIETVVVVGHTHNVMNNPAALAKMYNVGDF